MDSFVGRSKAGLQTTLNRKFKKEEREFTYFIIESHIDTITHKIEFLVLFIKKIGKQFTFFIIESYFRKIRRILRFYDSILRSDSDTPFRFKVESRF